jgi:uncharacterized integral membrane protein (TIGR00698 family)
MRPACDVSGMGLASAEAAAPPSNRISSSFGLVPGLVAAVAVAAVAWPLGRLVPQVGSPAFGLALGVAVASAAPRARALDAGLAFASRYVLQAAVVVLGATLSLGRVSSVGWSSLPVLLVSLAAAFLVAFLGGRLLRVPDRLTTLVGVGTGICGASAIAAVSGVVGAAEAEIAYAISTIFAFNLVAIVLFPLLGHLLGLSESAFGVWAGTAINDTSSVVAAAYSFGSAAGAQAVVVKLTRTLAILPVAAALAVAVGRTQALAWRRIVPWFLLAFVLAAGLRTAGAIPRSADHSTRLLAEALITVALAAIGLSTRLGDLRRTGPRPLLLGGLVWVAVAVASLAVQRATGKW